MSVVYGTQINSVSMNESTMNYGTAYSISIVLL